MSQRSLHCPNIACRSTHVTRVVLPAAEWTWMETSQHLCQALGYGFALLCLMLGMLALGDGQKPIWAVAVWIGGCMAAVGARLLSDDINAPRTLTVLCTCQRCGQEWEQTATVSQQGTNATPSATAA